MDFNYFSLRDLYFLLMCQQFTPWATQGQLGWLAVFPSPTVVIYIPRVQSGTQRASHGVPHPRLTQTPATGATVYLVSHTVTSTDWCLKLPLGDDERHIYPLTTVALSVRKTFADILCRSYWPLPKERYRLVINSDLCRIEHCCMATHSDFYRLNPLANLRVTCI